MDGHTAPDFVTTARGRWVEKEHKSRAPATYTTPALSSAFQELLITLRMSLHSEGPHGLPLVSSFQSPGIPKGIPVTAQHWVPWNYLLAASRLRKCTYSESRYLLCTCSESGPTCYLVTFSVLPRSLQCSAMSSYNPLLPSLKGHQVGFVQKSFHTSEYVCHFSLPLITWKAKVKIGRALTFGWEAQRCFKGLWTC